MHPVIEQAIHPGMAPQGTQDVFCKNIPLKHVQTLPIIVNDKFVSHFKQMVLLSQSRQPIGQCKHVSESSK